MITEPENIKESRQKEKLESLCRTRLSTNGEHVTHFLTNIFSPYRVKQRIGNLI